MDDCVLMKDVLGSDHCPVKAIIDLKFIRAPKCPSFCTKYYPEFAGTQKKLFEFFNQKLSDHELCSSTTIGSADDSAIAYGKRKVLDTRVKSKRPKSDTKKQVGILNFFQPSETKTADSCGSGDLDDQGSGNRSSLESSSSLSSLSEVSPDSFECTSVEQPAILDPWNTGDLGEETLSVDKFNETEEELSSCTAPGAEKTSSSAVWKTILTGPKCPPKCRGHREPCVQRCVKKKGPNFNRKFWVCSRGEGRSNDPSARCDYFLWDSNR